MLKEEDKTMKKLSAGEIIYRILLASVSLAVLFRAGLSFFGERFVTIERVSSAADGNLAVSTTSDFALYIEDGSVAARLYYPGSAEMEIMVKDDVWYFFSEDEVTTLPLKSKGFHPIAPTEKVPFDSGNAEDYKIVTDEFTGEIINTKTNETVCRFYRETLYRKLETYATGLFICTGLASVTATFCRNNPDKPKKEEPDAPNNDAA